MSQQTTRVWAVLRIVDGDICFVQADGTFAELCDESCFFAKRNDAFEAAQASRGLVALVGEKLAAAYALEASWWPHNHRTATDSLRVVSGGS